MVHCPGPKVRIHNEVCLPLTNDIMVEVRDFTNSAPNITKLPRPSQAQEYVRSIPSQDQN